MNGNCHLLVGIASGVSTGLCLSDSPETTTLLIATAMIGSLFPDIDNPKSHIGKLTEPVSTGIGKISAVFGATKEHHRGIFHDLGLYFIGLVVSYMYFPPVMGFFIGAISHCILDAFNASGVPVLLGLKRFHLAKISGDSKAAKIVTLGLSAFIVVLGIYYYTANSAFPIEIKPAGLF